MKTMIFMLLPFAAFSQLDTVFLRWEDDQFFEIKKVTYEDGRKETLEQPLGDTNAVVNYYYGGAANLATEQAKAVNQIWLKDVFNQALNTTSQTLDNSFGVTIPSISNAVNFEFFKGDYTLNTEGKKLDCGIDLQESNLAVTIDSITYPLYTIGQDLIVLYYNEKPIELFRVIGQDAWMSIDRATVLLKKE